MSNQMIKSKSLTLQEIKLKAKKRLVSNRWIFSKKIKINFSREYKRNNFKMTPKTRMKTQKFHRTKIKKGRTGKIRLICMMSLAHPQKRLITQVKTPIWWVQSFFLPPRIFNRAIQSSWTRSLLWRLLAFRT